MSKKVLLIGGFGGLGYELAKVFAESNWEVTIEDLPRIKSWKDNIDTDYIDDIPHKNAIGLENIFGNHFRDLQVDVIVYLAETNDIGAIPDDYLVKNNIVNSTYVASNLAYSKCKRLVVVGWQENFGNFNLLTRTLKERVEYTTFFNKGNNVISHMYLPRLIGPYHHSKTFGNIVKRVYKYLSREQMPVGLEEEITCDTSIKDNRTLDAVSFMSSRQAAICIYNQACRNTRAYENPRLDQQYLEYPLSIAKFVASELGVKGAEFRTDKESHNIDSVTLMPREEIQELIEECIDVWNRNGNQESSS